MIAYAACVFGGFMLGMLVMALASISSDD